MGGLYWHDVVGRDPIPSIANRFDCRRINVAARAELVYARLLAKDYKRAREMNQRDGRGTLNSTEDRHGEQAAT